MELDRHVELVIPRFVTTDEVIAEEIIGEHDHMGVHVGGLGEGYLHGNNDLHGGGTVNGSLGPLYCCLRDHVRWDLAVICDVRFRRVGVVTEIHLILEAVDLRVGDGAVGVLVHGHPEVLGVIILVGHGELHLQLIHVGEVHNNLHGAWDRYVASGWDAGVIHNRWPS